MKFKSRQFWFFGASAGVLALGALAFLTGPGKAADPNAFGPVPKIKVNAKKAALGKRLFFDVRLSGDAAISCASCHKPDKGFADGLPLAKAYPGSEGFRNTPTLINTAHKAAWFHDGRLGTNLNDVTRESLTETYNMNMDMRMMQERIKQDPVYVQMFADAEMGEPSNGGVRNAIPEYLKTLTSRGAPRVRSTRSSKCSTSSSSTTSTSSRTRGSASKRWASTSSPTSTARSTTTPTASPTVTGTRPCRIVRVATERPAAPIATRIPISRLRSATTMAATP